MKEITLRDKLADIVKQEFMLYSIFERLGINVAYKELTVDDVCEINGINRNLFLIVANTYINNNYIPEEEVLNFPVSNLVDYLNNTHSTYNNSFIPRMQNLFRKIRDLDPTAKVHLVNDVYLKTQKTFIEHYEYEDNVVFPAIIKSVTDDIDVSDKEVINFITDIENDEHLRFVEALEDLLSIFLKYVKPNCRKEMVELLAILDTFTKDLTHHMLIEDRYLYSRIKNCVNG